MSLGVLESGFFVGALIFTMRGIGKSTPAIKASPSLNIERNVASLILTIPYPLEMKGQKLTDNIVPP